MANKHLSYRQFKNIFGDLGVTAWTKYNWLSNGLKDGVYNGITKLTITGDEDFLIWRDDTACKWFVVYSSENKLIPISSNAEVWAYGFSNWQIVSRDNLLTSHGARFCVNESTEYVIKIEDIENEAAARAYLKAHPLIIYYYDRREWTGHIFKNAFKGGSSFINSVAGARSKEVRDVEGVFPYVDYLTMVTYGVSGITSSNVNDNILIRTNDFDVLLTDEFNAKYTPRAVVYRQPTQVKAFALSENPPEEI